MDGFSRVARYVSDEIVIVDDFKHFHFAIVAKYQRHSCERNRRTLGAIHAKVDRHHDRT